MHRVVAPEKMVTFDHLRKYDHLLRGAYCCSARFLTLKLLEKSKTYLTSKRYDVFWCKYCLPKGGSPELLPVCTIEIFPGLSVEILNWPSAFAF